MRILTALALLCFLVAPAFAQDAAVKPVGGIAIHGEPKYKDGFTHFDYVNPDAPKGGTLRLAGSETFDSFNPFIPPGVSAEGLGLIYMTLFEGSADEPSTSYSSLAESIETPADRSWAIFNIRQEAKWADGKPITTDDVIWSFNTLKEKGMPFYAAYYSNVKNVEALSDKKVKFTFDDADNRELPMIVGELTILPKHYWTDGKHDFTKTTLVPPLGDGPYRIGKFVPGHSIEYIRNTDWWAKDLPINKGRYNFDRITYDYYKDRDISLEAFIGGQYDFRQEYTAKLWATAYDTPAVKDGRIIKKSVPNKTPAGMQGFTYNIRRPVFQNRDVRKALDLAFDFEWSNKQFAYGAYTRTRSYFDNSEMAATGVPTGRELEILEKFRGKIPEEVFTTEYNPAKTDGSGNNRANLLEAGKLLDQAGFKVGKDGVRVNDKGTRLTFELLVSNSSAQFDRWFGPLKANLDKLGVKATFRVVDASQYTNRVLKFDYDMIIGSFGGSNSPGNEQREFWGSEKADATGSRNYIGIKDPVIDELVSTIISAPSREELVVRCRALDRVLQWNYYLIPNWHITDWRIAYWNHFGMPSVQAPFALGVADTWWDESKKK